MDISTLDLMERGWFIGGFTPAVYSTEDVEVAIKKYKKNDEEDNHIHKIATEITVILSGKARMNDRVFSDGDIITIFPGEEANFYAMTDLITVVIKFPSVVNDKYIVEKSLC